MLNASFELPRLSDGTSTIENIPGWSVPVNSGNPGVYNPPASAFPTVVDRSQTLYSTDAQVIQTLPVALTPNTVYTLGVFVGRCKDFEPFPGFTVLLRAGTTVLATRTEQDVPTPEPGEFVFVTLTYVSPAGVEPGQMLQISLDSNGEQTNFDSVRLDATPFFPTNQ